MLLRSLNWLQVKIWNVQSGFCFVTFSDHTAPVTAVAFLPSGSVVVSASLDGTVRAFDLVRYRNFRTMTSPHPVQFVSLAVDPAGEVRPPMHPHAFICDAGVLSPIVVVRGTT